MQSNRFCIQALLLVFLAGIPQARGESPFQSIYQAPSTEVKHQFRVSAPFNAQPINAPEGLTSKQIGAPYQFSYLLGVPFQDSNTHFVFGSNLSFTQSQFFPMFGMSPGFSHRLFNTVISGQLDFQVQSTLVNSQYKNSPYSLFYWGPNIRIDQEFNSFFSAGLEAGLILSEKNEISYYEGTSTLIDHKLAWVISPSFVFNPTSKFSMDGSISFYQLGTTAIASRDFSYFISSDIKPRYSLGATYHFGPFSIHGVYSYVPQGDDPIAFSYHAPFLTKHYLLSKQVFLLELAWRI